MTNTQNRKLEFFVDSNYLEDLQRNEVSFVGKQYESYSARVNLQEIMNDCMKLKVSVGYRETNKIPKEIKVRDIEKEQEIFWKRFEKYCQ